MKCTVCNGTGRKPSPTGVPMIGATSCDRCFGKGTVPAPPAVPPAPSGEPDESLEAENASQCPYIVTGDEGTSHCSLAETRPAASPEEEAAFTATLEEAGVLMVTDGWPDAAQIVFAAADRLAAIRDLIDEILPRPSSPVAPDPRPVDVTALPEWGRLLELAADRKAAHPTFRRSHDERLRSRLIDLACASVRAATPGAHGVGGQTWEDQMFGVLDLAAADRGEQP